MLLQFTSHYGFANEMNESDIIGFYQGYVFAKRVLEEYANHNNIDFEDDTPDYSNAEIKTLLEKQFTSLSIEQQETLTGFRFFWPEVHSQWDILSAEDQLAILNWFVATGYELKSHEEANDVPEYSKNSEIQQERIALRSGDDSGKSTWNVRLAGKTLRYLYTANGISIDKKINLCSNSQVIFQGNSNALSVDAASSSSSVGQSGEKGTWRIQGELLSIDWNNDEYSQYNLENGSDGIVYLNGDRWFVVQNKVCR